MKAMIDETYVKPFIQTTLSVLNSMAGLALKPEMPRMIEKSEQTQWNISSIIGLAAGEVKGNVSVNFKMDTAERLTRLVLGESGPMEKDLIISTIEEIVNTIAGNVTRELGQILGQEVVISLPSVYISESGLESHFGGGVENPIAIPFLELSPAGEKLDEFQLYIGFNGL